MGDRGIQAGIEWGALHELMKFVYADFDQRTLNSLIEGNRIDWVPNAAILTPAGALHSQHNEGDSRMFSFFVQDRGPREVRTWEPPEQQSAE